MRSVLALAALSALTCSAGAQHSELVFEADGGELHVLPNADGQFVYAADFGDKGFPANQIDHPEFVAEPGGLNPGDLIGFDVVHSLLYWNGSAFDTVPTGESVNISLFPLGSVDVGGPQPGFLFAQAGPDGSVNQH